MEIIELRLLTHRLSELRAFYADTLGLPLVSHTADTIALEAGTTRLVFTQSPDDEIPNYHIAFNIPENQLLPAKAWLKQRTALIAKNGEDQFIGHAWDSEQVYFFDPAGNLGEFIAHHTLASRADTPFGPQSILGVSEVGLPVDDVRATVDGLNGALGTLVYKEGNAAFMPIGDERGLFIITRRGRPWFPTDRGATIHQTTITMRGVQPVDYHIPHTPYDIHAVTTERV